MTSDGDLDEDCTREGCGHGFRWHADDSTADCCVCDCPGFELDVQISPPRTSAYGKLVPPFPVKFCALDDCRVELTEQTEAYAYSDLESGKYVIVCGASAVVLETQHAERFKLVML